MYIHCVDQGENGKYKKHLLRSGTRINGTVKNRNLANLSSMSHTQRDGLSLLLKWKRLLRGSKVEQDINMQIAQLLGDKFTFEIGIALAPQVDRRFKRRYGLPAPIKYTA